jgi:glycosyltransferase involved in cell wall biosynthesis
VKTAIKDRTRLNVGIVAVGVDGGKWGIGHYLRQILKHLPGEAQDLRLEVLVVPSEAHALLPEIGPIRPLYTSELLRYPLVNFVWFLIVLPWVCRSRKFDVLFLPAANRRIPLWAPCPMVGTVHDLAPIRFRRKYAPFQQLYYNYLIPKLLRKVHLVLCVSNRSKTDALALAGVDEARIRVIPNGVDRHSFRVRDPESTGTRLRANFGLSDPYVLFVSRIEHPGKNHVGLIRAFEQVKLRYKVPHILVLVGSQRERADKVMGYVRNSRVSGSIVFTGFVAEDDLVDLYCGADLFVHPSLSEGFGLPVLEAMACGTAVACANRSSLPEVVGDAAALFDPETEEEMISCIGGLLANAGDRAALVREGLEHCKKFDWTEAATRTLEALKEAARRDTDYE